MDIQLPGLVARSQWKHKMYSQFRPPNPNSLPQKTKEDLQPKLPLPYCLGSGSKVLPEPWGVGAGGGVEKCEAIRHLKDEGVGFLTVASAVRLLPDGPQSMPIDHTGS